MRGNLLGTSYVNLTGTISIADLGGSSNYSSECLKTEVEKGSM